MGEIIRKVLYDFSMLNTMILARTSMYECVLNSLDAILLKKSFIILPEFSLLCFYLHSCNYVFHCFSKGWCKNIT